MNIDLGKLDIVEHLTDGDAKGLFGLADSVCREGAVFVEVGSWKGHSTMFLGLVAKECNGHVYCIDHWRGSEGVEGHKGITDCFDIFRHNMVELGLGEVVHPLVMDSETAVKIFKDGVADLVFIDADHRYQYFKHDLGHWWGKVKEGGIICGHDSDIYYSSYPNRQLLDFLSNYDAANSISIRGEVTLINGGQCIHAGVARGLYEFCNDTYETTGTSIWYIRR